MGPAGGWLHAVHQNKQTLLLLLEQHAAEHLRACTLRASFLNNFTDRTHMLLALLTGWCRAARLAIVLRALIGSCGGPRSYSGFAVAGGLVWPCPAASGLSLPAGP